MATLVESIRTECGSLTTSGRKVISVLDTDAEAILNKAEDVAENRKACGEEVTNKLFATLESSLRTIMKASALHQAQDTALVSLPRGLIRATSPAHWSSRHAWASRMARACHHCT